MGRHTGALLYVNSSIIILLRYLKHAIISYGYGSRKSTVCKGERKCWGISGIRARKIYEIVLLISRKNVRQANDEAQQPAPLRTPRQLVLARILVWDIPHKTAGATPALR